MEDEQEVCKDCEAEDCQEHCDHTWDADEGFMCIDCGAEYPW